MSLRDQLLVALVAPTALVLVALAWVADRTAFDALEAALGRRLTTVAASATTLVSPRVVSVGPGDDDSRTAQNALRKLDSLREATGVARILLVSAATDRVLVDTERTPAGSPYVRAGFDAFELESVRLGVPAASVLFAGEDGTPVKTGYAPMVDGDRVVAYAAVVAPPAYDSALERMRRQLFGGAAAALVALIGLAVLFARWLSVPLARLAAAATRIGRGELQTQVQVAGPDEAQVLGRTMNDMAQALRTRDARLQMMLAGIAHEVRNPLGGIELFGGLLLEDLPPDDPRRTHVDRILNELHNLAKVVNDFLDYARQRPPNLAPTDMPALIRETWELVEGDADTKGVQVRFDLAPIQMEVDADEVRRALLNLTRNAVQATEAGSTVRLELTEEDGQVLLAVEDQGPGVPADVRDQIFEPFFTTKEKGTGLGLALVQRAAEVHGGRVRCSEAPGGGARFEIRLPRPTRLT